VASDQTEYIAISRFAAKLSITTLELLDKYDRHFFDLPLSETFSWQLQYRIQRIADEFLRDQGINE